MKILLSGYYGYKNFGDDWLMSIVASRIFAPGRELTVSCHPGGASYIKVWLPNVEVLENNREARGVYNNFDRVLYGGGGTVFDYRSRLSPIYEARKRLGVLLTYGIAKQSGTRFASIGLGIGPFGSQPAERLSLARLAFQDRIFARDADSLLYARSVLSEAKTGLCPDLSLAAANDLIKIKANSDNTLLVIRSYKYGDDKNKYIDALIELAEGMKMEGRGVVWVSFQPDYDLEAIERVERGGDRVWKWDPLKMKVEDMYELFAAARQVVTARMHGIYLAGMMGVPVVGVGLHPKLAQAANVFPQLARIVSAVPTVAEITSALVKVSDTSSSSAENADASMERIDEMFEWVNAWLGSEN